MTHARPDSRRKFLSATVGLGAMALLPGAGAQTARWPAKPIRIVVAFPPGGLTDAYARMYAEQLAAKLGVAAFVENKPGGGAIIGIDAVAKSPADGYTLLMATTSTHGIAPNLYKKAPYDPVKDFESISLIGWTPNVLAAHPSVPANSVKELIALAKAQPGKITFASSGTGSSIHLAGELYVPGKVARWAARWP